VKQGRVFYSALGHVPEMFSDPLYTAMLRKAIVWAAAH
jgi:type 1 glutamine amidotransferase